MTSHLEHLPTWAANEAALFHLAEAGAEPLPEDQWPDSWKGANFKDYPRMARVQLPPEAASNLIGLFQRRRSIRSRRGDRQLAGREISGLLRGTSGAWRHGLSSDGDLASAWMRAFPSAGARWATELYCVLGSTDIGAEGLYHYDPAAHALSQLTPEVSTSDVNVAIDQGTEPSEAYLIVSGVFPRMWVKYGARGSRFVHMEAGVVAANATAVATELGLDSCIYGGFDDTAVATLLDLEWDLEFEAPMAVVGVNPR